MCADFPPEYSNYATAISDKGEVIKLKYLSSTKELLNGIDTNLATVFKYFLFKNDATRAQFICCICSMAGEIKYTKELNQKTSTTTVEMLEQVHKACCPVCSHRFVTDKNSFFVPMSICSTSALHVVCKACNSSLQACPICTSKIQSPVISTNEIERIKSLDKQLQEYCFDKELMEKVKFDVNVKPTSDGSNFTIYKVNDYAIKCPRVIQKERSTTSDLLLYEVAIAKSLSHLGTVVPVYGCIKRKEFGTCVVMKYIEGAITLRKAIDQEIIANLPLKDRIQIAIGIVDGLSKIHLAGVVHNNFEPENILLEKQSNGCWIPKITNFGNSCFIKTESTTLLKNSQGSVGYEAPEMCSEDYHFKNAAPTCDIYALAFVLYELLTGRSPFLGLTDSQIVAKFTVKGERPLNWQIIGSCGSIISESIIQVIQKAWSADPKLRPCIDEIKDAIEDKSTTSLLVDTFSMINLWRIKIDSSKSVEDLSWFEIFALYVLLHRIKGNDTRSIRVFIEKLRIKEENNGYTVEKI